MKTYEAIKIIQSSIKAEDEEYANLMVYGQESKGKSWELLSDDYDIAHFDVSKFCGKGDVFMTFSRDGGVIFQSAYHVFGYEPHYVILIPKK